MQNGLSSDRASTGYESVCQASSASACWSTTSPSTRTVTVWAVAMAGILRTSNVTWESSGAVWKTAYSSVR